MWALCYEGWIGLFCLGSEPWAEGAGTVATSLVSCSCSGDQVMLNQLVKLFHLFPLCSHRNVHPSQPSHWQELTRSSGVSWPCLLRKLPAERVRASPGIISLPGRNSEELLVFPVPAIQNPTSWNPWERS